MRRIAPILFLAIGIVAAGIFIFNFEVDSREKKADVNPQENIQKESINVADENGNIIMYYDDRHTFDFDVQSIKSYNKAVKLGKANNEIIAVECGKAKVKLENGDKYKVTVKVAPISLVLIVGQSNAEGRLASNQTIDEVRGQCVLNDEGQAYETYGVSDNSICREVIWLENSYEELSADKIQQFLPNSLTDNLKNNPINSTNTLTKEKTVTGKTGMDAAFAYEWKKETGEKIWIINASHHGSKISSWIPREDGADNNFQQAINLYKGAEKILSKEIEAGHYTLSHKGIIWCQGENDFKLKSNKYCKRFETVATALMEAMNGSDIKNMEKEAEFFGIVMPRAALNNPDAENDFILTGPRQAQYFLAISSKHPKILIASQTGENWKTDEDVKRYFKEKYNTEENFNKAYPTEEKLKMPSSIDEVHKGFHYTQLGYNEIGFDAAANICKAMNYNKMIANTTGALEVILEDGQKDVSDQGIYVEQGVYKPIAVRVYPTYLMKHVNITCSDNVRYSSKGIKLRDKSGGNITIECQGMKKTVKVICEP